MSAGRINEIHINIIFEKYCYSTRESTKNCGLRIDEIKSFHGFFQFLKSQISKTLAYNKYKDSTDRKTADRDPQSSLGRGRGRGRGRGGFSGVTTSESPAPGGSQQPSKTQPTPTYREAAVTGLSQQRQYADIEMELLLAADISLPSSSSPAPSDCVEERDQGGFRVDDEDDDEEYDSASEEPGSPGTQSNSSELDSSRGDDSSTANDDDHGKHVSVNKRPRSPTTSNVSVEKKYKP